jgi:hypothetical protein
MNKHFANVCSVAMTFKCDIIPWSPTLEESCGKLAIDAETEGDEILIAMARFSRISLQANELHRHLCDNPESNGHAALHVDPLKKTFDQLRDTLSDKQKEHCVSYHLFPTMESYADDVLSHRRCIYFRR